MAHFAKVVNGVVVEVIVAEQEFIDELPDAELWIQTSYNTRGGVHFDPVTNEPDGGVALRKNYASIGGSYNAEMDAFIPEQPYPSWVLNPDTCLWEPPVPRPSEDKQYTWVEETLSWVEDSV